MKPAAREELRPHFLLTNRPVIAIVNGGEDQLDEIDAAVKPVADELGGVGEVIGMCVQLEAEAATLDTEEERVEMLRSEEHTSELQSLMRISYAVFCLKQKKNTALREHNTQHTSYDRV